MHLIVKEMPTFMLSLPPYGSYTQGINMITYRDEAQITAIQAIDLYIRSSLGERRPIDHLQTFESMLKPWTLKK